MYVQVSGSGDDKIAFLHGLATDHRSWNGIPFEIAENGFTTYNFDLPGFGKSKPAQGDLIRASAAQVVMRLRILGVDEVTLVGHSYGAAIAATVALTHPDLVKRLVLISPAGFWSRRLPISWHFEPVDSVVSRLILPALPVLAKFSPAQNTITRPFAKKTLDQAHFQMLLKTIACSKSTVRGVSALSNSDLWKHLPNLETPVHLIWGGSDHLVSPKWAGLVGSRLRNLQSSKIYPEIGHLPQYEARDLLVEDIVSYMKELSSRV